jgi:muramoyltetrapeptide carboxypeptidase
VSYPALNDGSTVAVIAPAGPVAPAQLAQVAPFIESLGWQARLYPGCFEHQHDYLAGTDAQRLADLHAAFADPAVHSIWCLRGGYGCGRLLPHIDTGLLRRHPKLLMGYSDITALHALLNGLGLPSLHAPMPASDLIKPGREADRDALVAVLRQGLVAGAVLQGGAAGQRWHAEAGSAEGVLLGGNLSLVASLLGTPWALPVNDPRGALLFLEDINEEPYKVDRLLGQLDNAGVLAAVRGFVIGSFSEEAAPDTVLMDYLLPQARLGKPVISGWPSGHGTPNRPLPLGCLMRMDAAAGSLTLLETLLETLLQTQVQTPVPGPAAA